MPKLKPTETRHEEHLLGLSIAPVGEWNNYIGPVLGGAISYDEYSNSSYEVSLGFTDNDENGIVVFHREKGYNLGLRYEFLSTEDLSEKMHRLVLHNPLNFKRLQLDGGIFAEFGHGDEIYGGGGLLIGGKFLIVKPGEAPSIFVDVEGNVFGELNSRSDGPWAYGAQAMIVGGVSF